MAIGITACMSDRQHTNEFTREYKTTNYTSNEDSDLASDATSSDMPRRTESESAIASSSQAPDTDSRSFGTVDTETPLVTRPISRSSPITAGTVRSPRFFSKAIEGISSQQFVVSTRADPIVSASPRAAPSNGRVEEPQHFYIGQQKTQSGQSSRTASSSPSFSSRPSQSREWFTRQEEITPKARMGSPRRGVTPPRLLRAIACASGSACGQDRATSSWSLRTPVRDGVSPSGSARIGDDASLSEWYDQPDESMSKQPRGTPFSVALVSQLSCESGRQPTVVHMHNGDGTPIRISSARHSVNLTQAVESYDIASSRSRSGSSTPALATPHTGEQRLVQGLVLHESNLTNTIFGEMTPIADENCETVVSFLSEDIYEDEPKHRIWRPSFLYQVVLGGIFIYAAYHKLRRR